MGQWAARRRRGGRSAGEAATILITDAFASTATEVLVTFSAAITAGDFSLADFALVPSGSTSTSIMQSLATQLSVMFAVNPFTQTDLNYTGDTPGVVTPQTIQLSI